MKKLILSAIFFSASLFGVQPDLAKKLEIQKLIEEEAKDLPVKISADGNVLLTGVNYNTDENILSFTSTFNKSFFIKNPKDIELLKEAIASKIALKQKESLCSDFKIVSLLFLETLVKYNYVLTESNEPLYTITLSKKACGYTGEMQVIGR